MTDLPTIQSHQLPLGELAANPEAHPWPAVSASFFVETQTGQPPTQATWVKTAHTAQEWRVLFYAEDDHIWATHTQRDAALYEEEVVEIFVDPSGFSGEPDAYFEFQVNPLNTVLDLALRRSRSGFKKNFAWNCEGFRSSVQRFPEGVGQSKPGWCAEISIPFASIGVIPPAPKWRVNFLRIDRPQNHPRELSAWSPTFCGTFHQPNRFGILEFVSLSGERNAE